MSTFTPGPWSVNHTLSAGNQSLGFHITGPRDGSLSPVCYGADTGYGELDANARLIASAPDLLDALRDMAEYTGEGSPATPWRDIVRSIGAKARAAIAKAEGKA